MNPTSTNSTSKHSTQSQPEEVKQNPHDEMPPGIPYIIGNEIAERFSFYGMRVLLVIFMTEYLKDSSGNLAVMNEEQAKAWYHLFVSAVYFFPLLGAFISDIFWGKYKTIFYLSIVYCFGHLVLAIDNTRIGLAIGLTLIAIGSGGIKPCVSANVGDQFTKSNLHLMSKVFGWFYFAINLGSAVSTILTPYLLKKFGPHVAFGTPGFFMFLATFVFWLGRHKYINVPPSGKKFIADILNIDAIKTLFRLSMIYIFVAVFWALYDQTGSAWILQANYMNRNLFGKEWLPAQIYALNPILILGFIPLFTYVIYPMIEKVWRLTYLRKIGIGLFLTSLSFIPSAWIEHQISLGFQPHILWQCLAYVMITAAEIMVSITALEFSYTQAPNSMKSFIMSLYLLSISLGDAFTALVNMILLNPALKTIFAGPRYYLFFAGLMFIASLLFIPVALKFKERVFVQGSD